MLCRPLELNQKRASSVLPKAAYKIPGSARTDALCLLWVPISRLPGRSARSLPAAVRVMRMVPDVSSCRHVRHIMPPFLAAVDHMDRSDAFALARASGRLQKEQRDCQKSLFTQYHREVGQNGQLNAASAKTCREPCARCPAYFLHRYVQPPAPS